jgi:hypothetical protein
MAAVLSLLLPSISVAQQPRNAITGFATVFGGISFAGDVEDPGWTPGASVAIVESNGFGAEVDFSHSFRFDNDRFTESGITSLMLNFTGIWNDPAALIRPYFVVGAGLIRVRACVADCRLDAHRSDFGFDAGAGVFVLVDEIVGVRGDVRYFRYADRHSDFPLTDDSFFDFWRVTGGVTFSWPVR